jgi:hypothetical protein
MGQRNIWNEKVGGAIKESRDKWGVRKRVDCTGRDLLKMYVLVSGPDCIVAWITNEDVFHFSSTGGGKIFEKLQSSLFVQA